MHIATKAISRTMEITIGFQMDGFTCAGVSDSLIGCPSNLNLICLIERPYGEKQQR